uniref:Uncharacterized protein n=1 Tax=Nelumbo nucifera TaxID=4432 RepID=A0A822YAR2_NELNU|nr:TPA_asm: hypothetical protein HUJ06_010045 [Nelumbo nucifera]
MYEALFSFDKASCLALFLHKVENRFFTALSVLHQESNNDSSIPMPLEI